jgi:glycosyltransferase involved in cell wall biosynthesis
MITNKEKNFVSVVIYIHNNEKYIEKFIRDIADTLDTNFEKYEIICVNDYSEDDSITQIKKLSDKVKGSLSFINMSFYQGIELAMNAGVDLAIGDFVFEFDSVVMDYPLETIMKVYYHSLEGNDIVSAAPKKIKSFSSRLFYSVFNRCSKSAYKIRTESFRILSRRAINRVHAMSRTIPYRKAIYANCGLKTEMLIYDNSITDANRQTPQIKEKRKDMAINTIILFTDVAYKFAIILAGIMMLVTAGTAVYTMVIFLGNSKPVEGWTTTMLFLSFAFFGVFAISAVIIKYLTIILSLIFVKQRYTIESIEKINK